MDSAKPDSIIELPIGNSGSGKPIVAWITQNDLDMHSPKARVLLLAGLDRSIAAVKVAGQVMQQFYGDEQFASVRQRLSLSAIIVEDTEGLDLSTGYPPPGNYYADENQRARQYLWRWIGMHAPDRVIELVSRDASGPGDNAARAQDSLITQLSTTSVAGLGTMESRVVVISKPDELLDALQSLAHSSLDLRSPARQEILKRTSRSPEQVARQLAKVYGYDLPSVAYIPAVACLARLRLARLTNDPGTLPEIKRIASKYIDGSSPTLNDKSTSSDIAGHILWGELFDKDPNPRYVELVRLAADRAFDSDGQPLEFMPLHNEMSDAVFMGCPVLALAGRLTGDDKYYEMCVRHLRFMTKLNLRSDGLHRHSPLDSTAWGRGNGFPALGLALTLESMPEDHPNRREVMDVWRAQLRSLLKHQDITGAWHQVIDHPESYRELSCTCMIVYAMACGVRRGWLDEAEFAPAIRLGWQAIKARVAEDGQLVDVCTGTGKMTSLREYLDRTAILGPDARGGAMALLVATEMMQWPEKPTN